MDVKTAFLHGLIKEEAYVEQPEGVEIHDVHESHMCRLKKALYGLKQAPRAWTGNLAETRGDFLIPTKYAVKILERFGMVDCKPMTTSIELDFKKLRGSAAGPVLQNATEYRQFIGALMFLNSHLDICFVVNTLSQHMVEPHHTLDWCQESVEISLWHIHTRKQKSVAFSTVEVEYIAASMASCEVLWFRKLFSALFGFTLDTAVILCDNQNEICLSKNPVFHYRFKHIDIRYHYIRDMVQWGAIRLQHIGTNEQVADILTKPLGKVKLLTFRD
eukprot:PITA_33940